MNPGLLTTPLHLLAPASAVDELGQPTSGWEIQRVLMTRRMPAKAAAESTSADRENERQKCVFRLRSQPFLSLYREGCRLQELPTRYLAATQWDIESWAEVPGTRGVYLDVLAKTPTQRGE